MGIFDSFFGTEEKHSQVPTKTPQQMGLLNQNIKQAKQLGSGGYNDAMGLLQQYLDPNSDVYSNFEKPYTQQFEQQTLPGIAERFAGANAMGGGLMNSGFGQSLGAAGANLQTQLAQMKQQYQRQSINDLLGQYNQLTKTGLDTNTFENVYQPAQEGWGTNLLKTGATALGSALGGPLGGALSSGFSGLFGNNNQSQPFSAGIPGGGSGYKGSFGNLPNYAGY